LNPQGLRSAVFGTAAIAHWLALPTIKNRFNKKDQGSFDPWPFGQIQKETWGQQRRRRPNWRRDWHMQLSRQPVIVSSPIRNSTQNLLPRPQIFISH
jgi:hypothetical protein